MHFIIRSYQHFFPTAILAFFVIVLLFANANADEENGLLVIIRSQSNEYHNRVAVETKQKLDTYAKQHNLNVKVLVMHHEWPVESAWIILPLMPSIAHKYADDFAWVMFIEENTSVNLKRLFSNVLSKYDFREEVYIGRCLVDQEISIIHHFAFHDGGLKNFSFPDFHAGWVLSKTLVQRIADQWDFEKKNSDFQIDVQHEIAMYLDKQFGVKMTCCSEICGVVEKDSCATWVEYSIPDCGNTITLDDILISVKTTKQFHDSRVKIVQDTWGKFLKHILYYSNITDSSIPTIDCGIPNTVIGHCGKMEVIINDAHNKPELAEFSWLVIADDDSIIGISQLVKLLNCYNTNVPVVLGERYGFRLNSGYGYSYVTGGGSMVMSRGAIKAWVDHDCKCPSIDAPDDMFLGQCFSTVIGVPVIHSPRFHQARPNDYSKGYLTNLQPVSFHKHWLIDPTKVYEKYFDADDRMMFSLHDSAVDDSFALNAENFAAKVSAKDEL